MKLGRLDDAERFAQRALREEEEAHRPYALVVLGWVQQHRGNLAQANQILREAISSAQETQDKLSEAAAARALGGVLQAQGQTDEADVMFAQAIGMYEALGLAHEVAAVGRQRMGNG